MRAVQPGLPLRGYLERSASDLTLFKLRKIISFSDFYDLQYTEKDYVTQFCLKWNIIKEISIIVNDQLLDMSYSAI